MDSSTLREENAALLALVRSCEKPDTWASLTNECVVRGSAVTVYEHRLDPIRHPYPDDWHDPQGTLFDDAASQPTDMQSDRLRRERIRALADLDVWKDQGLDFVSVFDPRFPSRLRATVDVPPFLFADGTLVPDDRGVSVVGSRHCTPEGMRFARACAGMLIDRGLTVVAGLAKGIDAFAHRTALEQGGRTVAFIGTGIRRCYPPENRDLQREIAEHGLVLSQFWPDAAPTRHSFPIRNALMSGYGIATIVADAGEHSGTRIQARQAQRHGRPVIINRMVLDKAKWARDLAHRPGIYIVGDAAEAAHALDDIQRIDTGVDQLIRNILQAETAYA